MRYLSLITLLTSFIVLGCSRKDGKYIVYNSAGSLDYSLHNAGFGCDYSNDTIDTYLRNKLSGNTFDIHFDDEYVTVQSVGSDDKLVLHKEENSGVNYYELVKTTSQKMWAFRLYVPTDGPIIFQVKLGFHENDKIVLPVQLGGGPERDFYKQGVAICYLSKSE